MNRNAIPSPIPYIALAGVCAGALAGSQFFPDFFFPAFGSWVIGLFWDLAALGAAWRAWGLYQALWKGRAEAIARIEFLLRNRNSQKIQMGSSADTAGRTLSRVIRNADEDLKEINPDFTLDSLIRLSGFLPNLLDEIQSETDAKIRLGVVGAYLGETACRLWGWQWKFQSETSLRQFEYLVSILEKGKDRVDPFELAGELFSNKLKSGDLIQKLGIKEEAS